ncbi:MAG: tRNA pseudouridine(38-40) synthase TruA, partial [Glaciimonas sp.]|nr:tRNA pseudouridine(38-40) synthase TruA [Glaciimonas sp.]
LTVQDKLESALQKFTQNKVATICAGRTDAGVHALEQVVHFDTPIVRSLSSWVRGVNAFLPTSIAVSWATEVPYSERSEFIDGHDQFHARFSATSRTYHYLLYNHPVRSPILANKAGWAFRSLDVAAMCEAAQHFVGTHDFSAFRAIECQAQSPSRTMHAVNIEQKGDLIVFTLRANAFLHHMVRNIIGALIFIGNGKESTAWISELLLQKDRSLAAPTFMPDGLYLGKVEYDKKWELPQTESSIFP